MDPRNRLALLLLAVVWIVLAPGCAEEEEKRTTVEEGDVREALAEATPVPTVRVQHCIEFGFLVKTDLGLSLPWLVAVATMDQGFDVRSLEHARLHPDHVFKALLKDAKADGEALPDVARMLTSASIRTLTYTARAGHVEGEVGFDLGKTIRVHALFEAEALDGRVRVTTFRLPDSGWATRRRPDGVWQGRFPRRPGPIHGISGDLASRLMEEGGTLEAAGVNAVWLAENRVSTTRIRQFRKERVAIYVVFDPGYEAIYLREHPDAAARSPAPAPSETAPAPPGICPTHEGFRAWRLETLRKLVRAVALDGVWLDPGPAPGGTGSSTRFGSCHCERCQRRFTEDTGIAESDAPNTSNWMSWQDYVWMEQASACAAILKETPRQPRLGLFHGPCTPIGNGAVLRTELGLDLRRMRRFINVLSPVFDTAEAPASISQQVERLGQQLHLEGRLMDSNQIWPAVRLTAGGTVVPASRITALLEHAARAPSSGVIVFPGRGIRAGTEEETAVVSFLKRED